jgi:hypothetical protein
VYLSDEEAERLRQRAAATGRPQAELVREAIRRFLGKAPRRRFHSMASGESTGKAAGHWNADDVYEKTFGRR